MVSPFSTVSLEWSDLGRHSQLSENRYNIHQHNGSFSIPVVTHKGTLTLSAVCPAGLMRHVMKLQHVHIIILDIATLDLRSQRIRLFDSIARVGSKHMLCKALKGLLL